MNEMTMMQKEILFNWETPSLEDTLDRLYQVRRLTVDRWYRDQITIVICQVLEMNNSFEYERFLFNLRLKVEQEINQLQKEDPDAFDEE